MPPKFNTQTMTISTTLEQIRSKQISAAALTDACLQRIQQLNPNLNAFITVQGDDARRDAIAVDDLHINSQPLLGVPIAVKDLYETKGIPTTAGTPWFKDHIPETDSVVVNKLKNAGSIILGKTNTHEIALGVTGVNPHFGTCLNPWDAKRISGGSSSGSAVAVATGMCLGAVGTDTGGSIRIPASLCGVVGLKPTYGRVSLRGIIPLSWTLDHAGPLTRSVRDAAMILQVIAGYDELDPSSIAIPVDDYLLQLGNGITGMKVALAAGDYVEESDIEVTTAISEAARIFKSLGAEITQVNMDPLRGLAAANGQIVQADAAAFHRERLSEHPDWFGADIRERLENGRALSSTDYSLARRTQVEGCRWMDGFFREYDVLMLPTTPITAPLIEATNAIEQARRLTRFTAPFNLTGLPALTLPCGFDSSGLPIGLQVVSGAWREAHVLKAGHAFEQATAWHKKSPQLGD